MTKWQVNLYIYQTIKGPGTKSGAWAYVLETESNGKIATLTDKGITESETENKNALAILLKALKRLRMDCDLTIIGANNYIKTGFTQWIDKWIASDWKTAKGNPIANIEEWQQLREYREKYNITISDQEDHTYLKWMKAETNELMEGVQK